MKDDIGRSTRVGAPPGVSRWERGAVALFRCAMNSSTPGTAGVIARSICSASPAQTRCARRAQELARQLAPMWSDRPAADVPAARGAAFVAKRSSAPGVRAVGFEHGGLVTLFWTIRPCVLDRVDLGVGHSRPCRHTARPQFAGVVPEPVRRVLDRFVWLQPPDDEAERRTSAEYQPETGPGSLIPCICHEVPPKNRTPA